MRPSGVQVPPAESVGASATRVGRSPPETDMRQMAPCEKYARDEPSGEKNGELAPIVSCKLAIERRITREPRQ